MATITTMTTMTTMTTLTLAQIVDDPPTLTQYLIAHFEQFGYDWLIAKQRDAEDTEAEDTEAEDTKNLESFSALPHTDETIKPFEQWNQILCYFNKTHLSSFPNLTVEF